MNLKSKNTSSMLLKRMSLLLILVLFFTAPFAQGPGTTDLEPEVDNTGAVPIDGGLSLVLAAGLGYGAKKIRDYNKKRREEEELDRMDV